MAKTIVERSGEALAADHWRANDRLRDVQDRLEKRSRPDNDLTELLKELDLAISDYSTTEAYLYHFDELRHVLDDIFCVHSTAEGDAEDPGDGTAMTAEVSG